ncbi:heterokaryon incompatibility (het-6OR allele) [Fusarium albosuccineum]|uniref:Heterokaryon incompatibility (Het-6OR allele) n=1 Tax=Fusarium albosuccineum TaxID=1237068 RepID=A0A8H4KV98_9HYPO|nr:heterokaryon incompatibility (het-6OR allele) [Fusarium albosuccineum]
MLSIISFLSSLAKKHIVGHFCNNQTASFPYRRLELNRRQIRILLLLPGRRQDPIRCALQTAFLDDAPIYQALSYVWGDPLDCRPIELDGKAIKVTVNLHNALRRLRCSIRVQRLWVDAICINQTDDAEKSHQVNLMKEIYSRSSKAILWLGDFSDDSDTKPAGRNQIASQTALAAFQSIHSMAKNKHLSNKQLDGSGHPAKGDIYALSCLFELPWWHRVWTVQEAVLPGEATIMCGTLQIPWSQFAMAHQHFEDHYEDYSATDDLRTFWNQMMALRAASRGSTIPEFPIAALNMFRLRHATDPRDRVYAFLGLSDVMPADYSVNHEEAFKLWVLAGIRKSGCLSPLLRVPESGRSPTLPTWVPDWCATVDWKHHHAEMWRLLSYSHYKAAGETVPSVRTGVTDSVLELSGLVVDQIVEVGEQLGSKEGLLNRVAQWQAIAKHHPISSSNLHLGKLRREAAWRTLLADVWFTANSKTGRIDPSVDAGEVAKTMYPLGGTSEMYSRRRKGFTTTAGRLGVGSADAQVGDVVCVFLGGKMPFILRRADTGGKGVFYRFVGEAYVHGIMDGQALDEGRPLEWISLV